MSYYCSECGCGSDCIEQRVKEAVEQERRRILSIARRISVKCASGNQYVMLKDLNARASGEEEAKR